MSLTFSELYYDWDGAIDTDGRYTSASVHWLVLGTDDETAALAAAVDETPAEFQGLARQSIEFDSRVNETACKVVVNYGGASGGSPAGGEAAESISFDTAGGSQHVTQSLSTRGRYPADYAPDLKGAIGYDGEQVAGVDIVMPALSFTLARIVAAGEITTPFRLALSNLTGKVNDSAWKGYNAGELLFMGAAGSGRVDQPIEITYRFAYSPTRTAFMVGDIPVAEKRGWDYMWVRYEDAVDTAQKARVRKPAFVYIEQVYEAANFAALGLGR